MGRELCNECHTSDNYEKGLGQVPGTLLYNWQVPPPPAELSVFEHASCGPFSVAMPFLRSLNSRHHPAHDVISADMAHASLRFPEAMHCGPGLSNPPPLDPWPPCDCLSPVRRFLWLAT